MKKLLAATLCAAAILAAAPALAQRLLAPYEIEQLVAPFAHYPDAAIRDAIAAHPDLAYTYAQQPSEVWRVVLELRQRISPPAQTVIIHSLPPPHVVRRPSRDHAHHRPPPDPNGPPSPAVQMQQGHLPSPAVRMQQERIPESQRQPIVQQRPAPRNAVPEPAPRPWRGAP